jgi:hypothetical protein
MEVRILQMDPTRREISPVYEDQMDSARIRHFMLGQPQNDFSPTGVHRSVAQHVRMGVWAEWIAADAAESSVEDRFRLLMTYFQNLSPKWQDKSAKSVCRDRAIGANRFHISRKHHYAPRMTGISKSQELKADGARLVVGDRSSRISSMAHGFLFAKSATCNDQCIQRSSSNIDQSKPFSNRPACQMS